MIDRQDLHRLKENKSEVHHRRSVQCNPMFEVLHVAAFSCRFELQDAKGVSYHAHATKIVTSNRNPSNNKFVSADCDWSASAEESKWTRMQRMQDVRCSAEMKRGDNNPLVLLRGFNSFVPVLVFCSAIPCLVRIKPAAASRFIRKASRSLLVCADAPPQHRRTCRGEELSGGKRKRWRSENESRTVRLSGGGEKQRSIIAASWQAGTCAFGCLPSWQRRIQSPLRFYLTCRSLSPFISLQSLSCSPHLWWHFSRGGLSLLRRMWWVAASLCQGQVATTQTPSQCIFQSYLLDLFWT